MGHKGMKYSLASRELIATALNVWQTHIALTVLYLYRVVIRLCRVCLWLPERLNIPSIFVSGGPMFSINDENKKSMDLNTVFEAVGAFKAGKSQAINSIIMNATHVPAAVHVWECLLRIQ